MAGSLRLPGLLEASDPFHHGLWEPCPSLERGTVTPPSDFLALSFFLSGVPSSSPGGRQGPRGSKAHGRAQRGLARGACSHLTSFLRDETVSPVSLSFPDKPYTWTVCEVVPCLIGTTDATFSYLALGGQNKARLCLTSL